MWLCYIFRRNMKSFYFCVCFFVYLSTLNAEEFKESSCLEREKALTLLETAEDLLTKAENSYPSCKENITSTNQSECQGKKPLAYIEISKKLISDVRENFPICPTNDAGYDYFNDCSELLANGIKTNGIYKIRPREVDTIRKSPLEVYCDMNTDRGGWTLIQRRGKFPVQQDFYLDWESYKNGFGNIKEEFWLGNENIRVLCHKGCKIRFDLQVEKGEKRYAVYQSFSLSKTNYTLHISDFTGTAGDGMRNHNNKVFSTKDQGDTGRANTFKGAWWYSDDNDSNLNGIYQSGGNGVSSVFWYKWQGYNNTASAEIKVKPKK